MKLDYYLPWECDSFLDWFAGARQIQTSEYKEGVFCVTWYNTVTVFGLMFMFPNKERTKGRNDDE